MNNNGNKYVVPAVKKGELNINSKHSDYRARLLSNLTNRPFEMNGQMFASVEAFFAGILYHVDNPIRRRAFASCYGLSQKLVKEGSKEHAWWNNQIVDYGSAQHKEWCRQAILECTLQNSDRLEALKNTSGLVLVHNTGFIEDPKNFLSRKEFCKILTQIRNDLL